MVAREGKGHSPSPGDRRSRPPIIQTLGFLSFQQEAFRDTHNPGLL